MPHGFAVLARRRRDGRLVKLGRLEEAAVATDDLLGRGAWDGWTKAVSERHDLGGGSLEQLRPWLGCHWPGGAPREECRAALGRQARPEEAQGASCAPAKGVITR